MTKHQLLIAITTLTAAALASCGSDPTPTADDGQREISENTGRDVTTPSVPSPTTTASLTTEPAATDPTTTTASRTTEPAATDPTTTAAPTTSAPDAREPVPTDVADDADDAEMVSIVDFAFDDQDLEIPIGTTVRWVNDDPFAHSVVANDGLFASELLEVGDEFEFTFGETGQFDYVCGIHPSMAAAVSVVD